MIVLIEIVQSNASNTVEYKSGQNCSQSSLMCSDSHTWDGSKHTCVRKLCLAGEWQILILEFALLPRHDFGHWIAVDYLVLSSCREKQVVIERPFGHLVYFLEVGNKQIGKFGHIWKLNCLFYGNRQFRIGNKQISSCLTKQICLSNANQTRPLIEINYVQPPA